MKFSTKNQPKKMIKDAPNKMIEAGEYPNKTLEIKPEKSKKLKYTPLLLGNKGVAYGNQLRKNIYIIENGTVKMDATIPISDIEDHCNLMMLLKTKELKDIV